RLHPGHPVPARPGHRHPGVLRHGARRPRRRRPPPARPVLLVAARRDPRGRAPRLRARHRPDPPRSGAGAAMSAERAPTLRQILGYPPLAETVSLTGDEGLDRPVTGIVLVDAAGAVPVRPGTIALCPAVPGGERRSWRRGATVRRLRDPEAAAFAVPSPAPGEETMPGGSRRLARHLGLPVLAVGHDPLRWAGDAAAFLYAPAVAAAELLHRAH